MFETRQAIMQSLQGAGISKAAAKHLAALALPAVWLKTSLVDDESLLPPGATKIGGHPDLPAHLDWPIRPPYPDAQLRAEMYRRSTELFAQMAGKLPSPPRPPTPEMKAILAQEMEDKTVWPFKPRPLSFVAQIDLTVIPEDVVRENGLPNAGRFLLFYDFPELPFGLEPGDSNGACLMYDRTRGTALERRPPPIGAMEWPALACDASLLFTPCPDNYLPAEAPETGAELINAYCSWTSEVWDATPRGGWMDHHVGGHPTQLQSDMRISCREISETRKTGGVSGSSGIDDAAPLSDWVLLFQIASDDLNDMMWADGGFLYVWITRDDLAAMRFDRAIVILESH